MAEQLGFNLPVRPALTRGDFLLAPSNAVAVAMIDRPEAWGSGCLVLSGPDGSGKTHLAHVWAAQCGAPVLCAADLAQADIPALAQGPVAVEDVPGVASDMAAQKALFHLFNMLVASRQNLLLTGRKAPGLWDLSLPDLKSRVQQAQHAALEPPGDDLLAAVLAKLFADRQVRPRPDVIPYLVTHMERSFAAAADIVARLDHTALVRGKAITRAMASELLGAAGDPA